MALVFFSAFNASSRYFLKNARLIIVGVSFLTTIVA
jgi:hypothetical protein